MRLSLDELHKCLSVEKRQDGQCDHSSYREWHNGSQGLTLHLQLIGEIAETPVENQFDLPYWGNDAPINFRFYPYYGCEVLRCRNCKELFLHYREIGGHAPQERYRLLRKELIVW
jgi:hypothetical protein